MEHSMASRRGTCEYVCVCVRARACVRACVRIYEFISLS